jgi:glycosyltransferase involved in cell wall biosynthesis
MAAGIPVIATQVGGISDFLFDEELNPDKAPTGWAVEPHNPKNIADKVEKILTNKEKTKQIVVNAQKLVLEKYDWNLIASQMKEIFLNKLYGAN